MAKPDSSEQEIKGRCEATWRVNGVYGNHLWQLVLVHVNGEIKTEISEAACRFSGNALGKSGNIAFWLSDEQLAEYLRKRQINAEHRASGKRWQDEPYCSATLALSAACVTEWNLKNICSTIGNEEVKYKTSLGHLPKEPSLMPYSQGLERFRVFIKVDWAKDE